MLDVHAPFESRVTQALADDHLRTALDRATTRLAERRDLAVAAVDNPALRHEVRAIRQFAITHLPDMLQQLETNLIANGCQVHWARNAAEANDIVRDIARQHGVRRVVKSKSMLTEEIGLNEALETDGIEVVETDLGEYIIQLAHEPPSHILAPVIHKRAEDISDLFQRELGMPPTTDPGVMCATARQELRRKFLQADMGISGGNFAIAETGTICIITNEGNGRMVTSMPRVHVAVVGIEKVVPRVEDAFLLWQATTRNATGQAVSVYFAMCSGPRRPDHADGPQEMHVVLLDNGRSRIIDRGYPDVLLCIRCGACVDVCPVYREIGGHAYGATAYSGPIGAVLTPLLADDPTSVCELPFASSLCGACGEVCPAEIDLPRILLDLRSDMVNAGTSSVLERVAFTSYATGMQKPWRYRALVVVARWATKLLPRNGTGGGGLTKLLPPLNAWMRTRVFPRFARRSFRRLWRKRSSGSGIEPSR
ncbi:MAG: iron-sulfur cluster-binding protein [Gemmatimonadetes bacterium]|nr:iron-sulfur cluster-binding protein [Gemmatimonadota bacterium]